MTTDAEKMVLIERLDRALEQKNKMQRAKDDSLVVPARRPDFRAPRPRMRGRVARAHSKIADGFSLGSATRVVHRIVVQVGLGPPRAVPCSHARLLYALPSPRTRCRNSTTSRFRARAALRASLACCLWMGRLATDRAALTSLHCRHV